VIAFREQQIAVCNEYGAAPMATRPGERLAITTSIRTGILPIHGLRVLPGDGMCGWWIWAGGEFPTGVDAFDLALRYLADRNLAVAEIAYLLGFSDPSPFHRAFKRWTGTTPAEARAGL